MLAGRKWLRKLAILLALTGAGSVVASTAVPTVPAWQADPEAQFLLDVTIRQLRLGDGVRAYDTPEGTCVILGDMLKTLDLPVTVDLTAKKAVGWAFKEDNRLSIDLAARAVTYGRNSEPITFQVRETPEGWCVDSAALSRWLGIGVRPMTAGSVLLLESEAKLPVEMAMERQQRAARIQTAKFDYADLPQVRLPYRMWRAPALDFVVSAGATYRAKDGMKVDRRTSVSAAGEIARLSYDAQVSTTGKGTPNALRLRAYRSDPDSGLLGPLKATHFGFGDVAGLDSRLTGSSISGRGAVVTNRPLFAQASFDRTRFEGDLPSGWEAEIYRNGELLGFAKPTSDQRYRFEDVQLLYGENQVRIVLYGPQGQVRTREEMINIGRDNVPAGKTWYWAGVNQPGRDVLALDRPADDPAQPRAQAAVAVEHGLSERTSVGALARAMLVGDERLTFVEGTVRHSIGSALVELAAARDSSGGQALRAQMVGKIRGINVSAEAIAANDFHLRGDRPSSVRDMRLSLSAPIRLGKTVLPAHADLRFTDRLDGSRQVEAAGRLAANFNRFNLASDLRFRRQYLASGPAPPAEVEFSLMGTGKVGDVRLRGGATTNVAPKAQLRSIELSAYWSATEKTDWEGGLVYEAGSKRGRARISHVRRLDSMAVALTGEAATDGSLAVGLNLNFSLDAGHGLKLSRHPLASAGAVRAQVYRDLNDNGLRDPSEPFEKGALVTTGERLSERATDSRGSVLIGGLTAFRPITVGLDQASLADPMLVPRKALQMVVPRPGVPADVEIGLVGGGDIEGAIVKNGGLGFEGLDLELVDASGKVVATTRTDYDGFFLYQRVPYGEYRIRLTRESAGAVGLAPNLAVRATVSPDRSVVRLGSIPVQPLQIASTQ